MKRRHRIDAIVVAVPAQNEEQRIVAAVRCILAAAAAIDPLVNVSLSVAADSCTDGTSHLLSTLDNDRSVVRVVGGSWNSAGGARHAAVMHGLESIGVSEDRMAQRTWIATTDADSHVPADWLTSQLRLAELGYDAVAGTVELIDDDDQTADLVELFARNYIVDPVGTHTHVHGANMGIRASAYLTVGGFQAVTTSEDRLLWNELVRSDYRVVSPVHVRVATSGRLKGRVVGGFADAISNLWA
jgi:glycosyltransferase involved in cell wall biosynthesis